VVVWFSVVSTAVGLAGIAAGGGFSPAGWDGVPVLHALAGFALIGQICMTRAFAGPATLLAATMQYTNIGFAAVIGAFLFDDTLSAREGLGLAVIAASGVWATWIASRGVPPAPLASAGGARPAATRSPP
jgi:S-adenosylmethionine uptake transporter